MRRLVLPLVGLLVFASCATDDGRTLRDPVFDPPVATSTIPGGETSVANLTNGVGGFALASPAFLPGDPVPTIFTASGGNTSPPLDFSAVPSGAVELAIVVTNPDAENTIHWIVSNIDPTTTSIPEGSIPEGAEEQTNHFGVRNWVGPNTPPGEDHRYVFTVYALDRPVEVNDDFATNDVVDLIKQFALPGAVATMMGTHQG